METSTFRPLWTFLFQLPSPLKLGDWQFMINQRLYWWGFLQSYKFLKPLHQTVIKQIEIGILVIFYYILFRGSFCTSSAKLEKFDAGNVILFQIKVFAKNIKETTLARFFKKVTVRPSLTQTRAIRRTNRIH